MQPKADISEWRKYRHLFTRLELPAKTILLKEGEKNLHLIRFDNRDTGLSTHFNAAPIPDFPAVLAGDYSTVPYTLSDMAADVVGLMELLGLHRPHLVGASMGGIIAQSIAIEYRHKISSLTSIMSTTGALSVGQTDYTLFSELGQPPYHDREQYVAWRVRSMKIVASPGYPFDEGAASRVAGLSWDRDHDAFGMIRQSVAVLKSGDRTPGLGQLNLPTLVLHGEADRMINISGGKATAAAIPGAEFHSFPGMGHNLPEALWPTIAALIADHIHNACS